MTTSVRLFPSDSENSDDDDDTEEINAAQVFYDTIKEKPQ